jgi:hypothetical protein
MEFDPNMVFQKLRGLSNMPMAGLALPAIIRDSETGQVNWSNVITGGLTACVIAAGTSLISLNNKVAELAVIPRSAVSTSNRSRPRWSGCAIKRRPSTHW